jgi:hypothetical protein
MTVGWLIRSATRTHMGRIAVASSIGLLVASGTRAGLAQSASLGDTRDMSGLAAIVAKEGKLKQFSPKLANFLGFGFVHGISFHCFPLETDGVTHDADVFEYDGETYLLLTRFDEHTEGTGSRQGDQVRLDAVLVSRTKRVIRAIHKDPGGNLSHATIDQGQSTLAAEEVFWREWMAKRGAEHTPN